MDWNETLQKIVDYVELHLQRKEEPIDYEEISRMAGCSFSFFQKVFSYMNNISFAEYVRNRKLTLAGYDLKSTAMKVVEVSYKYGYDSPTSFSKAFQLFHGVSPSMARHSSARLKVYPKMQLRENARYSWQLKQIPALRLIGKSITVSTADTAKLIPKFWSDCQNDGTFYKLTQVDQGVPRGMFGGFHQYDASLNQITYTMAVISDQAAPKGYEECMIPENTWAIFDCHGPLPKAIQNGWKFLHEEWLMQYPFAHANSPELEWYSRGNVYDDDYLSQIWIPIIIEQ